MRIISKALTSDTVVNQTREKVVCYIIKIYHLCFSTQEETIQYGKGTITKGVDANQKTIYNLESENHHLTADLYLDFPSPIAGIYHYLFFLTGTIFNNSTLIS